MTIRTSGPAGNGWAWAPVFVTTLLATFVLGAAEDRGSGRAHTRYVQAAALAAAAAPVTPSVTLNVASAVPGQALVAAGTVPDTSLAYTLCLVPNGIWTIEGLTATPTPTPTSTPVDAPTPTPTNTPLAPPTATPTNTPTDTPTSTPTSTPTPTPTNTPLALPTATPTNTPTDTPTATPTNTPADTPTSTPTSTATNTPILPASNPPGAISTATTSVAGSIYSGSCVLQQPVVTATSSFSGVPLGAAPAPGVYDLLLLGPGGTVLAAQDVSAAAGLAVTGMASVPAGGRTGLFGFALLVAAGAWFLLRQFR